MGSHSHWGGTLYKALLLLDQAVAAAREVRDRGTVSGRKVLRWWDEEMEVSPLMWWAEEDACGDHPLHREAADTGK